MKLTHGSKIVLVTWASYVLAALLTWGVLTLVR